MNDIDIAPKRNDPILAIADAGDSPVVYEINDPILVAADAGGARPLTTEAKEQAFVCLKGPRSHFTTGGDQAYESHVLKAKARRADKEQMGSLVKDTTIAQMIQAEMQDWGKAVELGYDESIVGMYAQKEAPQPTDEKFTLRQQFIKEIVVGALDAPVSVAGAAPGIFTANPFAALGGAGAAPAVLRQWLMDEYSVDPEVNQMDLGDRLQRTLWEGTKAGAVGVIGGKAGEAGGKALKGVWGVAAGRMGQVVSELGAGTFAHSIIMNGEMPTVEDFRMSAVSLAAGHATHAAGAPLRGKIADARLRQKSHMEAKLMHIYEETGIPPNAVVKMARENTALRTQLASAHEGVPDVLLKDGPREKIDNGERPARDFKEDVRAVKGHLEDALVDDLGPVRRFVDEVEGKGAAPKLDAEKNPYKVARVARGWMGKVEHIMEYGGWDLKSGDVDGTKGLLPILKSVHKPKEGTTLQGFAEYVVSRRAVELEKRGQTAREALRSEIRDLRKQQAAIATSRVAYDELGKGVQHHTTLLQKEQKVGNKIRQEIRGLRQEQARLGHLDPTRVVLNNKINDLQLDMRDTWKKRDGLRVKIGDLQEKATKWPKEKVTHAELEAKIRKLQKESVEKRGQRDANEITGFRQYDLKGTIQKGDPHYKQAAKDFQDLNRSILYMQYKAGFFGFDEWNRIKNANMEYVPFKRLMDDMVKMKGFDSEGKPVKAIKGSGRPLTNVLRQWAVDLQNTFRAIEHNRVVNSMAELDKKGVSVKRLKIGKEHDALTEVAKAKGIERSEVTAMDLMKATHGKESSVIYGYKDGQRQAYQVPKDVAHAMNSLTGREWSPSSPAGKTIHNILKTPATLLRGGATSSPDFMFANIIRDISTGYVFSESGNHHIESFAEGAKHVISNSDTYKEWLRSGGAMGNLNSEHLAHLKGDVYKSLSERTLQNTLDVKKVWEYYQKVGGGAESATRVGEYIQAGRKGRGLTERAYQSRDISIDFGKAGYVGRYINDIVAFHNVGIQSLAKLHGALKQNPAGTAMRLFLGVAAPSIGFNLLFGDDERVKEVPQWERDLYWIAVLGDHLIRIPKPGEVGILFGSSFERGIDAMHREDRHAWDGLRNSLLERLKVNTSPTIAEPFVEALTNHSFFRNNSLIPHYMENDLPEFQRNTYTSATARKISSWIASMTPGDHGEGTVSPIVIDNWVQGWTAGMGRYATMGLDKFLRPTAEVPAEWRMEDLPVMRSFMIRSPKSNSRSVDAFMTRHKEARSSRSTANNLLKAMDFENYNLVMNDQRWVTMDGIYEGISNLRGLAFSIHNAKDGEYGLHGKELASFKTEQLEDIYKQITAMGHSGLVAYDKLDKQIEQLKELQH